MWIKTYSNVYQGITKEAVWQVWADINNYVNWHTDLDECRLVGDFAVGNYFLLKPKGAPTFKVFITELIKNKRFVDCTYFFGAKMFDIHELEETKDGVRITSTIKVTGILTFLWVLLVARNVANSAPKEMEETVKLARQQ